MHVLAEIGPKSGKSSKDPHLLRCQQIFQPPSGRRSFSRTVRTSLGLSQQAFPNPWTAALSASVSTAAGAFIPIIPFFFVRGYPAIVTSFAISTLAHFVIGAAKTVVTGLSPWRSGGEMTVVGLGEALITYALGLVFGRVVG